MSQSPISLIQWLLASEYQETQAVLKSFAESVSIFHRSARLASDIHGALNDWLNANMNAQYCFLGAHGSPEAIGASTNPGEFVTWEEVWRWFLPHQLLGGLWLGACNSSMAADAFSRFLSRDGPVIPHFYGFKDEIFDEEIEAILRCLIDFSDVDHESDLSSELELLRHAVPGTAVQLYYPAATLDGNMRYVNVDHMEEELGQTFVELLDSNRNRIRAH